MQEIAMNRATKFYKLLVVFLCYEGKEFRNRRRTVRFYRVLDSKIIPFTFIQNIWLKTFLEEKTISVSKRKDEEVRISGRISFHNDRKRRNSLIAI